MKVFEIWIGYYNLGMDGGESTEPKLLDKVSSVDFKTACMKYELLSKLNRIREGERNGDLNDQDYHWFFDPYRISCSWLGKYYETREEALASFPKKT